MGWRILDTLYCRLPFGIHADDQVSFGKQEWFGQADMTKANMAERKFSLCCRLKSFHGKKNASFGISIAFYFIFIFLYIVTYT